MARTLPIIVCAGTALLFTAACEKKEPAPGAAPAAAPAATPPAADPAAGGTPAPVRVPDEPAMRDSDVPGGTGIDPSPNVPKLAEPVVIGNFRIALPMAWESRPPSSAMRAAEFVAPGGAEVVFFGDLQLRDMPREQMIESNIARWRGQVLGPGGEPSQGATATRVLGPFTITQYTATGTYLSGMPGQGATRLDEHTLVGAIIEGPGGVSFVRMTGPAGEVAAALPSWTAMLNSVQEK